MAKKERFEAVQPLRFICFLMVFVVHSALSTDLVTGVWALEIFFMLSGFMMVYSYADRDLPSSPWRLVKFGYQRIGKLYPLHVETTLLQLPMCVAGFTLYLNLSGYSVTWVQVLQNMFALPLVTHLALVQDWVPDFRFYIFNLNGPSWFLSAMVFSYALFPLVIRLLKKLKTTGNVLAVCGGIAIFNAVLTTVVGANCGWDADNEIFKWLTQHCPAVRFFDFFMGCALGWIFFEYRRKKAEHPEAYEQKPVSVRKWTVIEVFALLLIPLQELYPWFLGTDNFCKMLFWCRSIVPVLLSAPVILVFVLNRGYVTKALNNKVFHYLGDISMYMYLIHYLFCNAWTMKETAEGWANPLSAGGTWAVFAAQFVLTVACSIGYDRLQKYKVRRKKEKLAAKAS